MVNQLKGLYQTNDDIIYLLNAGSQIGWKEVKPQSIHRIIYLSKVLYSFVNEEEPNIFSNYHFSSSISGPISSIINDSLIDLQSKEFVISEEVGLKLEINEQPLKNRLDASIDAEKQQRQNWFKVIILLLGKFGENKIFSFTINDPLYLENIESNSPREIQFENAENKTLEVLNSFKIAFEESLSDTSSISREEYLELYFDYIFSQIIK
jgi:hypothetical protein